MCDRCHGFSERFRVERGREYHDLVRQLIELTKLGTFLQLSATVPLEDVLRGKAWNDEVLIHVFRCSECGRQFRLSFDTYRGLSAVWEMMVSDAPRSIN